MSKPATQDERFTMYLQGGSVPARFTDHDGGRGVEIEGVTFPYVTDEVPHGIVAETDEQRRKMSELRVRCGVTSEASVLPFKLEEETRED